MFFDDLRQRRRGAPPRHELRVIERSITPVKLMTFDEVQAAVGQEFAFDVEIYVNYFLVSFLHIRSRKYIVFELFEDGQPLNYDALHWCMWAFCLVSFNGVKFDVPMVYGALKGLNTGELKALANALIQEEMRPSDAAQRFGFNIPHGLNHIDIMEVLPGKGSLKKYSGRLHLKRLQELPYAHEKYLDDREIEFLRDYNLNSDLPNTADLFEYIKPQIRLREAISKQYGEDVRSKSDAQIAEVVIVSEVRKRLGYTPKRATFKQGDSFFYKAPEYITYSEPGLQRMLQQVQATPFVIDEFGSPRSAAMQELRIIVAGVPYAMGLGGLHSMESCRTLVADDEYGMSDIDVASYYPNNILNAKIRPASMGDAFEPVFQDVVDRRVSAKRRMTDAKKAKREPEEIDVTESDSLKITANGTFGKLGSAHSAMYAPEGMIAVTIGGQLLIIMLIHWFTWAGFEVVSANTDGICVRYKRSRRDEMLMIVKEWERRTKLETEETEYAGMYQRDVNNYFAVKTDGEVKLKGVYAEKGSTGNTILSKNPKHMIVSDAVVAFLTKGTPFKETINKCKDIRRFVVMTEVGNGGGQKNGLYLGRLVRWYYGVDTPGIITKVDTGTAVPDSEGACPCMDLPDDFPSNIDLDHYYGLAVKTLEEIGYIKRQSALF